MGLDAKMPLIFLTPYSSITGLLNANFVTWLVNSEEALRLSGDASSSEIGTGEGEGATLFSFLTCFSGSADASFYEVFFTF